MGAHLAGSTQTQDMAQASFFFQVQLAKIL
jgi:hypothetical protein